MSYIAIFLALIVSFEHFYILVLEMFFSQTKRVAQTFSMNQSFLQQNEARLMMANQGLYNGFLAVGIIFSLFFVPTNARLLLTLFFLGCVIVAGVYGAMTVSKKILLMQGVPAIITFVVCLFLL